MKVATLEKFHLRRGNQDPGDPGVREVRGGKDFFSFKQGGGGLTLDDTMIVQMIVYVLSLSKLEAILVQIVEERLNGEW